MGSSLRLTLGRGVVDDDPVTGRAWDAVVELFAVAEAAMSRFRETSELTRLNRNPGSSVVSRPSTPCAVRSRPPIGRSG